jgi:hypothetical protein
MAKSITSDSLPAGRQVNKKLHSFFPGMVSPDFPQIYVFIQIYHPVSFFQFSTKQGLRPCTPLQMAKGQSANR